MAQTREDIEKQFSASFKGIKNEKFPVKNLAFKIFIFILYKIRHFCQNFKKSCFILFIDVWPLCCRWYIVIIPFLAHLSRRLSGELIGYPWIRRPSSSSVVRSHFQTTSPQKPLGQSKPNFMWSFLGKGERKFI